MRKKVVTRKVFERMVESSIKTYTNHLGKKVPLDVEACLRNYFEIEDEVKGNA